MTATAREVHALARASTEREPSVEPGAARGWRIVTYIGLLAYILLSLAYVRFGPFNADEGWYLYAARRVMAGEMPYRDFAFTQMPLMPYTYGLPQALLGPSIFLGRATSFVLSVLTALLAVKTARRYGGIPAGGIAALLLASLFYEAYHSVTLKTYALVAFCCVASFALLGSRIRDEVRYPLAAGFALAAAMTRLSAVFFALPVLLYCLAAPRERVGSTRLLIGVATVLTGCIAGLFIFADPQSAHWHLLTHHTSQWGDATAGDMVDTILFTRLPNLVQNYEFPLALALVAAIATASRPDMRAFVRTHRELPVVGLGLILFAGSHLLTGGWHPDYLVPAAMAAIPLVAALFGRMWGAPGDTVGSRALLIGVLVAVVVLNPLSQLGALRDALRDNRSLGNSGQVSAVVAANTDPDDTILALEALSVAVEADRPVLPGLALAHFSYQDVSDAQARAFNVVNADLLLTAIRAESAAMLVLTDRDWAMFGRVGVYNEQPRDASDFRQAVAEHYREVAVYPDFGQFRTNVYLYLRRSERP